MRRTIQRGLTEEELLEQQIEDVRHRRFLKAMALKSAIGLSDEERHELAQMIPGVDKDDGGSWKELNPKQLSILINMLEGWTLIEALIRQRPQTTVIPQTYTVSNLGGTFRVSL